MGSFNASMATFISSSDVRPRVKAHSYATILKCIRRSFSITSRTPAIQAKLPVLMQWLQVQNPACGDILKLSMKLSNGHIADIRFLAKGCVPAMACASALTELVKGKTVEAAQQLRREELVRAVGDLPEASTHASYLAMDALAACCKETQSLTLPV